MIYDITDRNTFTHLSYWLHSVNQVKKKKKKKKKKKSVVNITKTRLFKYMENFTPKNLKFSDKKQTN